MSNKIMELVDAFVTASTCLGSAPAFAARHLLQTEVTRLEAELADAQQYASGMQELTEECNHLRAKLAALEALEPVAWMRQWSFNGDETSFELYAIYGDCQKDAVYHGGICAPLYLAAGAIGENNA